MALGIILSLCLCLGAIVLLLRRGALLRLVTRHQAMQVCNVTLPAFALSYTDPKCRILCFVCLFCGQDIGYRVHLVTSLAKIMAVCFVDVYAIEAIRRCKPLIFLYL